VTSAEAKAGEHRAAPSENAAIEHRDIPNPFILLPAGKIGPARHGVKE